MADKFQLRRDTAANWLATNPVLSQGEPGVETDTLKTKIGDGVSTWTSLPYMGGIGDFLKDGTVAMTGPLNVGGQQIKNYTDLSADINVTTATTTIDLASITGRVLRLSMQVNTTLAFTNIPTTGVTALTLICTQDATGGHTLAFPAGTKAAGGTLPVLSTAAGAEDWIEIVFHPALVNPRAFTIGKGVA